MTDISKELNVISTAVYGRDMRQAIHDALDKLSKETGSVGFSYVSFTSKHMTRKGVEGDMFYNVRTDVSSLL